MVRGTTGEQPVTLVVEIAAPPDILFTPAEDLEVLHLRKMVCQDRLLFDEKVHPSSAGNLVRTSYHVHHLRER